MPGIQLSRDPKRSKAGGSLHTFGYLVFPLGGSLGPWPWKLMFGKDACREGGQLWAKVKKIHHHLRSSRCHPRNVDLQPHNEFPHCEKPAVDQAGEGCYLNLTA